MKEQSVLTVLMYLFNYHMEEDCDFSDEQDRLLDILKKAGFQSTTIMQALCWLTSLSYEEDNRLNTPSQHSFRVFSSFECEVFSPLCRSFLMHLEHEGILNAVTREMVINRVIDLEEEEIDLHLIKWVTLMVLFNQNKNNSALTKMELLVLDEAVGGMH